MTVERAAASSLPVVFRVQGQGVLLFLFIPTVLYLFVQHPEPVSGSLGVGVALMVLHRFLARPYMVRVAPHKCLWSNRRLGPEDGEPVEIHHRSGVQRARCLSCHAPRLRRFFAFVDRFRGPLAIAVFGPLLLLLVGLGLAAAGVEPPIPLKTITGIFQLVIGVTVNVAAWAPFLGSFAGEAKNDAPLRMTFPIHNFFLLGVSNLLWIFRLVGAWWIVVGLRVLIG